MDKKKEGDLTREKRLTTSVVDACSPGKLANDLRAIARWFNNGKSDGRSVEKRKKSFGAKKSQIENQRTKSFTLDGRAYTLIT